MGAETEKSCFNEVKSSPLTRFRDVVKANLGVEVSDMVLQAYNNEGLEKAAIRTSERHSVSTLPEWEMERKRFLKDYQRALGVAPPMQVEVKAKGVIEKDGLIIRKFLFSSFNDNWIPAVLFIPRHVDGTVPVVINACGHGVAGKNGYANRGIMLAANGYASLCFDLPGQGERTLSAQQAQCYPSSTQHNIFGCKLHMAGASLARIFVQDTVAAVSLLQQIDEIDSERIGITGSSGGGWLSVHAAAIDERIKVVVPAASVRSYNKVVDHDDAEQSFFNLQRLGIDFPDLLSFLICPRPLFIIANSKDIWPLSTTEYARDEARRFYRLHGYEDRIKLQVWNRGHKYQPDQLEEAIGWFNRHLGGCGDEHGTGTMKKSFGDGIRPEELNVCQGGNIHAMGFTTPGRAYWNFLRAARCNGRNLDGFLDFLKRKTQPDHRPFWAEMDRFDFGRGTGRRICFASEQNILLPAEILVPAEADNITIMIDECDRREDLEWQIKTAAAGAVTVRPDLRGWGETSNKETYDDWEGWARNLYVSNRYALYALAAVAGRSLVLDRVSDIRALLRVVQDLGESGKITIHGRRGGAWIALLAGLADKHVSRLILDDYPVSFREVMATEMPVQSPDMYLYGLLEWGIDVNDLVTAFNGEIRLGEGLDAHMCPQNKAPGFKEVYV